MTSHHGPTAHTNIHSFLIVCSAITGFTSVLFCTTSACLCSLAIACVSRVTQVGERFVVFRVPTSAHSLCFSLAYLQFLILDSAPACLLAYYCSPAVVLLSALFQWNPPSEAFYVLPACAQHRSPVFSFFWNITEWQNQKRDSPPMNVCCQ